MTNGENHDGAISLPGEVDEWTFHAIQGEAIALSLGEVTGAGTDPEFRPWIRLRGPDGTELGNAWWYLVAQIDVVAPLTGVYTVVVATNDPGRDAVGQYLLTLAKTSGTFVIPTGDEGGAMTNGANHSGTVHVGDLDQWTFTAAKGDAIALSLGEVTGAGTDPEFRPWIRLRGPDGTELGNAWWYLVAQINVVAPLTGTYTVVVGTNDPDRAAVGRYLLTLAKTTGPFVVPSGDEGGAMTNGANHSGTLHVGDLDQWTFTAAKGDAIALSLGEVLTNGVDTDFRPWIRLRGPDGTELGNAWWYLVAQLDVVAPLSGTYTVVVGTNDPGNDATSPYLLTLAKTPGAFLVPANDQGGVMTDGVNHSGAIHLGDLDQWIFTAVKGDAIALHLSEVLINGVDSDFRPWIRLRGPDGTELGNEWWYAVAHIDAVAPMTGTYTALVGTNDPGRDASADYILRGTGIRPSLDTDADGLPDEWETQYGLRPDDGFGPNGAEGDLDEDGRTNKDEFDAGTHPRSFVITYLAEGATGAFFDSRLAIANPTAQQALVLTRFQKGDGTTIRDYRVVPAMSRTTIDVETIPGLEAAEFSTLIEADVQVVADRTMTWDRSGYGSHAERGILTRTATKWYFAEGATFGPFNLFYLIQNPSDQTAQIKVTYLLPTGVPLEKQYSVAPQSRFNIWVDAEGANDPTLAALASAELSAIVESTNGVPIIAERAMYLDQPGRPLGAGHESAGVTAASNQWFLAEGATGDFFDLFILIANPQVTPAAVQADFLLPSGQVITRQYTVPANSRFNIWVDQEDTALANAAVSTRVTSTNNVPIIVERAMWWPGPTSATWAEAHNSPGETTTGTRWALAEGELGGTNGTETYVLVANTSSFGGQIRATVLFENGTAPISRVYDVAPNARFNIAPAADEFFPETRGRTFGMIVESIGATPVQIVVERAMYSNANGVHWAAGTNALATKLQ
ncbi:MAG TPA: hypothetical protein VMF13_12970 [Luteitalea sp.]|nr:hypothetical protein [Luteitalea sp.]